MAGAAEFNRKRFNELVLYLAERSSPERAPRMGRVKMNKLLYRSDFEAFRLLGRSISGATYLRGEHGPMAYELEETEKQFKDSGRLYWIQEPAGDYTRNVPLADEKADETLFSDDELEIINRALVELAPHGAKSVSLWSHEESVGWRLTKPNKPIPYETSVIASEPGPRQTVERLRNRVLSGDWD